MKGDENVLEVTIAVMEGVEAEVAEEAEGGAVEAEVGKEEGDEP